MIKHIKDIQLKVLEGFTDWKQHGNIITKESPCGNLLIFFYSPEAVYSSEWTFLERVSRGLIIEKSTGNIIGRGFDKFFNYGENDQYPEPGSCIRDIYEKVDGSLGIVYFYNNKWNVATKGSFNSNQAQWGQNYIDKHWNSKLDELHIEDMQGSTILTEIVYPDNRIVIDYNGFEGLYFLGFNINNSGNIIELPDNTLSILNLKKVQKYHFDNVEKIFQYVNKMSANEEGFVIRFSDNSRFKIKSPAYSEIHKLLDNMSRKNILKNIIDEKTDDIMMVLPEFLRSDYQATVKGIYEYYKLEAQEVIQAYSEVKNIQAQKDFALSIKNSIYKHFLFGLRSKKFTEDELWLIILKSKESLTHYGK